MEADEILGYSEDPQMQDLKQLWSLETTRRSEKSFLSPKKESGLSYSRAVRISATAGTRRLWVTLLNKIACTLDLVILFGALMLKIPLKEDV